MNLSESVMARVLEVFKVLDMALCNFWMPESIFMKLRMYNMATELISTAYFINPFHQSVCLYVYPSYRCSVKCITPFVARERLGKHVTATNKYKQQYKKFVRVIFYAIRVL
jgi:hypothetical protein